MGAKRGGVSGSSVAGKAFTLRPQSRIAPYVLKALNPADTEGAREAACYHRQNGLTRRNVKNEGSSPEFIENKGAKKVFPMS